MVEHTCTTAMSLQFMAKHICTLPYLILATPSKYSNPLHTPFPLSTTCIYPFSASILALRSLTNAFASSTSTPS